MTYRLESVLIFQPVTCLGADWPLLFFSEDERKVQLDTEVDDTEEEALVAVEVDGVAQLQLQVHLPAARLLQDAAGPWGKQQGRKK